jgi:hypothetical protein
LKSKKHRLKPVLQKGTRLHLEKKPHPGMTGERLLDRVLDRKV